MNKIEKLKQKIIQRYPDVQIRYKQNHWFWKRMPSKLLNSGMALPKTIWLPNKDHSFDMLAHEYEHLVYYKTMGFLGFLLMYLQPQLLSLIGFALAVVAFCLSLPAFSAVLLAAGVLCLLPWPSKNRAYLEMKGYLMSLYVRAEEGKDMQETMNFVIDALRSWMYYKMVWTKKRARTLVNHAVYTLDNQDNISNISVAFKDVYEIISETD